MVFYNFHTFKALRKAPGFTLVEALVAVTLIGVGVATTIGALIKFNSIAATSRNVTGATAVLLNQVDLFQTMGPFNPQKNQIPKDVANTPPTYNMTAGATHIIGFKDPTSGVMSTQADPWPVYREPSRWRYDNAAERLAATGFTASDVGQLAYQRVPEKFYRLQSPAPIWVEDEAGGTIVRGRLTCEVTALSGLSNTYRAVFTIGYQYKGRGPIWNQARNRWEYQLSMSAIRTSDI